MCHSSEVSQDNYAASYDTSHYQQGLQKHQLFKTFRTLKTFHKQKLMQQWHLLTLVIKRLFYLFFMFFELRA